MREVQRFYDTLRRRYFLDAPAPLHVPPPAVELRWGWLPETAGALALTRFDEDGDPYEVMLSPRDRCRTLVRGHLLHEMTHMRLGPNYACGSAAGVHGMRVLPAHSAWRQEALRLVSLGALQL